MSESETTYWTINDERDQRIATIRKEYAAKVDEFQASCPHERDTGWLLDTLPIRCWRRCCSRCFKCLEVTHLRPEGAIA